MWFDSKKWVDAQLKQGFTITNLARRMNTRGIKISKYMLYRVLWGEREFSRKMTMEIHSKWK